MISPKIYETLLSEKTGYKELQIAENIFKEEVNWASHLSIQNILIPLPNYDLKDETKVINFSRIINDFLSNFTHYSSFLFHIKFEKEDNELLENEKDPYFIYNKIFRICSRNSFIKSAIEIPKKLPKSKKYLKKWISENLKSIILPISVFEVNKNGFPVLSEEHEKLILKFLKHNVQIIFSGIPLHQNGYVEYKNYIRFIYKNSIKETNVDEYTNPYNDYLQIPLQPCSDNLASQTYEVFEKDPVKYKLYEEAILNALVDRHNNFLKKDEKNETKKLLQPAVVMVLGAGRGPLIKAVFRASQKSKQNVKVYAIEKNPHALVV